MKWLDVEGQGFKAKVTATQRIEILEWVIAAGGGVRQRLGVRPSIMYRVKNIKYTSLTAIIMQFCVDSFDTVNAFRYSMPQ